MWYVLQTMTGQEEELVHMIHRLLPGRCYTDCFVPYYEEKKKYQGTWHIDKRLLFPGYVFMVSGQLTQLYTGLRKIPGMTKLLGTGEEIVPLTEEEVALLKKMGASEKTLALSQGIIENGVVTITEGPLEGREGCIRKIDRHKRKVWLEIKMFGRTIEMEAGLEIVKKI